jgi:hypothetical protein
MDERTQTLCLAVFGAKGDRKLFPLAADRIVVGREPTCDIFLPDPSVSKRHALIRLVDGAPSIEDGVDGRFSANGVYVNAERVVDPRPLVPGDEVTIGVFRFTVGVDEEMRRVPTLAEVKKGRDLTLFLTLGDIAHVSDDEVVDRVTEMGLAAVDIQSCFDAAIDDAMKTQRLKRVAFLTRVKRTILDQDATAAVVDAESDPTVRLVIVVGGSAALIVIALTLFG